MSAVARIRRALEASVHSTVPEMAREALDLLGAVERVVAAAAAWRETFTCGRAPTPVTYEQEQEIELRLLAAVDAMRAREETS